MEIGDAIAEAALGAQLEIDSESVGERLVSTSDHHRREQQVDLVDQSGGECLAGQRGPADADVGARRGLEIAYRPRIELRLDPRLRAPPNDYRLQYAMP